MTDIELNVKIARLMGWTNEGRQCWHPGFIPCTGCNMGLPDFLGPARLGELMDLADGVLPTWGLGHDKEARMHIAKTERQFCIEESRSKAVARAIVAHAESKVQP